MVAKTFITTAGGTWDVPGNWSPSGDPQPGDDAFINTPGTYTVTMDNTQTVNSITLNDPSATLDVTASGVLLANDIALNAGTFVLAGDVIGGTITASGGAFAPSAGTLDGVTWKGPLIGATGGGFYGYNIKDGITLENANGSAPGTLDIGSTYMVDVVDATTLENMVIQFDNFNNEYLSGSGAADLNFGASLLLTQTIAGSAGTISGLVLNNLGTMELSATHGNFYIGASTLNNEGAIVVTGDTVTLNGMFNNSGVVSVNASAVVTIGASAGSTNDTTISVANAASLIVNGNLADSGVITIASHGVAELHNIGGSVVFLDPKGTLELASPGSFTGAIEGFQKGDTIDLLNQLTTNPPSYSTSTGMLIINDGSIVVATLDVGPNYGHEVFSLGTDATGTGTDVTVACYAEGTRILTATGEVAVEALCVGDRLPALLDARAARVRWLGHRRIDCRRHPRPAEVWPVRLRAGALAAAVPHRDLWLSPDHAVLIDGALIPVRHLVNGSTIAQVETPEVTYWHVELDRHDVLLAEGLAAESFLDTGNRDTFAPATVSDAAPVTARGRVRAAAG